MLQQRCTVAVLAAMALLVACGDDGPNGVASDVVEVQVPAPDAGSDGTSAVVAMEDQRDDATSDDEHDAMSVDEGDPMSVDEGDAMSVDEGDAMSDAEHDAMSDAEHDAMSDAEHDAMTDAEDAAVADDSSDIGSDDVAAGTSTGLVVDVEMVEFGFVADTTFIPVGVPVTFRFVNTGVLPHEAMFGSLHEQAEFAAAGDHGDGHGDADGHHGEVVAVTLEAGAASEILLEFATPGEVWIGCHLPGHYDAGMKAEFIVG